MVIEPDVDTSAQLCDKWFKSLGFQPDGAISSSKLLALGRLAVCHRTFAARKEKAVG